MSDERIKQLMAQTPLPESLSTYQAFKQLQNEMQQDIARLTAELATERKSNEKTYDHNNRLINEVDRLTAEVEKWKSIAQQINTDWIPANQALAEEVERLKELVCSTTLQRNEYFGKLSRYREALLYIYRGDGRINPTVTDLMYIAREALDAGE